MKLKINSISWVNIITLKIIYYFLHGKINVLYENMHLADRKNKLLTRFQEKKV